MFEQINSYKDLVTKILSSKGVIKDVEGQDWIRVKTNNCIIIIDNGLYNFPEGYNVFHKEYTHELIAVSFNNKLNTSSFIYFPEDNWSEILIDTENNILMFLDTKIAINY